jgi:V/A-type H+-transporting ATPase subunit D
MAEIKLTKNELRSQQLRLAQLEKYLPTLQLKKAMLQAEVQETRQEIQRLESVYQKQHQQVENYSALLTSKTTINLQDVVRVKQIFKHDENIAGVEVPYFESVEFEELSYNLFETPPWVDAAIIGLRKLSELRIHIGIVEEQKRALEKELREVSIRVNLFEKILIPRSKESIKKIKIFLGDQQLTAVSQAKAAKGKIEENKELALRKKEAQGETHA